MAIRRRTLAAVAASLAYLILDFASVGMAGSFGVFFIQAVLAALYSAAAVYLVPRVVWIPVAVVGTVTLLLPLVILVAPALPVYHSLPPVWASMFDVYSSEWEVRGSMVAVEAFGPLGIAALVASVVRFGLFRLSRPPEPS